VTAAEGTRRAYARSGVDVAAGDRAVELMRGRIAATQGPGVVAGVGGFASAVALPAGMRDPVLVSATDGVGTKTEIARASGRLDTIGLDLVAMCADDVVCLGARPLFFLDYVAVGRMDPGAVASLVAGVARGCELAECALVGGETAEHPGIMEPDQFDLAGFCVGVAERDELLSVGSVEEGDVLIGLAASGLHANGYSLVRSVIASHGLALEQPWSAAVRALPGVPEMDLPAAGAPVSEGEAASGAEPVSGPTLGDVLLTPTRIYAADVLALRTHLAGLGASLHGLAHITGGGLPGNVPRALPPSLGARIDPSAWPIPPVMRLIAALAGMDGPEMRATLNGGVGMVAVLPQEVVAAARAFLSERGVVAWQIGSVVPAAQAGAGRYVEVTS
jgi:phosphoribosylformylglycinamidine cyclo-ligase